MQALYRYILTVYAGTVPLYTYWIPALHIYLTFISSERINIIMHTVCMRLCIRDYDHCQISERKILSNWHNPFCLETSSHFPCRIINGFSVCSSWCPYWLYCVHLLVSTIVTCSTGRKHRLQNTNDNGVTLCRWSSDFITCATLHALASHSTVSCFC